MTSEAQAQIYTGYDIPATLASGQTFAFNKTADGFFGIADGKPVEISAQGGGYNIRCREADADFWRRYFDLDRSYATLLKEFIFNDNDNGGDDDIPDRFIGGKRFLTSCVNAFGGLRLLRQPVWETVCEFIISANNHQKRIEAIYKRISSNMGDAAEWNGRIYHAFPSAQKLAAADESDMRAMGLGYRAPYLLDTAKKLANDGFPDLNGYEYEDAVGYLTGLRGVGEKVADCVLLFATNHQKAFPVDVWIERALREHYGMIGTRHKLKLEAQALFGEAAGIAQQFLFHGMRSRLNAER